MPYLIKYSPEMTIKSRPVRTRFVRQLKKNLRKLARKIDETIQVEAQWDFIELSMDSGDDSVRQQLETMLMNTPGINSVATVRQFSLGDLEDILCRVQEVIGNRLDGKTFAVRCKRAGKHTFKSTDVESYVGGGLNQRTNATGVNLTKPDVTVQLEVRNNTLFVVENIRPGIGGFPLGSQDSVLSMISGGFDSAVSSYLAIRRGLRTNYCFFNLGGREHEVAVKEVALYLWMKFAASHDVRFVTIPFEEVVAEILQNVDNSQMGVVLKRMMLRAASQAAAELGIEALVTGESVAQVSSQTLPNLAIIDQVISTLVLRPLIMSDKQDIVDLARAIGTEEFSANIPEYCGVISVKPTTRARQHKIDKQESGFDFSKLDAAVKNMEVASITSLQLHKEAPDARVEIFTSVPDDAIVIDIRHPDEEEVRPLQLGSEIRKIPFYKLKNAIESNPADKQARLLLYCDKGMMSQLHASYLRESGYSNIAVYRPE